MATKNPIPFRYDPQQTRLVGRDVLIWFAVVLFITFAFLSWVTMKLDEVNVSEYREPLSLSQAYQDSARIAVRITVFNVFIVLIGTAITWWTSVSSGGKGEFYAFYRPYVRASILANALVFICIFTLFHLAAWLRPYHEHINAHYVFNSALLVVMGVIAIRYLCLMMIAKSQLQLSKKDAFSHVVVGEILQFGVLYLIYAAIILLLQVGQVTILAFRVVMVVVKMVL